MLAAVEPAAGDDARADGHVDRWNAAVGALAEAAVLAIRFFLSVGSIIGASIRRLSGSDVVAEAILPYGIDQIEDGARHTGGGM